MLLVICEGLGSDGAVANVAWNQSLGLSKFLPVCLISDGLSADRQKQIGNSDCQLRLKLVNVPGFTALRRFGHFPRQLAWILLAVVASQRELQAKPTVVICHSHAMAAAIIWWYGSRVHLVMVSHGDIFHRPPGSYDPAITWLYRCTTAFAHRRAAISVALSPVMAQRIQAHGIPKNRISLIPNGLDPAEIGLQDAGPEPVDHWHQLPMRILFVGSLSRVKGVETLLQALALARRPGLDLQLSLIGRGIPSYQRSLQKLVQQLGLAQCVSFLGPQPRSSLARHYRQAHVVVVPSLDDPLPTVVLEAMACGRPVLGSAVGGISYLVRDGLEGLLVPVALPSALAEGIARLSADRNFTEALGRASLESSRNFSWKINVSAMLRLVSVLTR